MGRNDERKTYLYKSCRQNHLPWGHTECLVKTTRSQSLTLAGNTLCKSMLEAKFSSRLEAMAIGSEAIALRVEAIAIRLEAIALRVEAIALRSQVLSL